MSKFKIITRIKENDEIISGKVTFKNLDKLQYEELDILISILYIAMTNQKNDIDIHGLDIFYTPECDNEYLILSVNSLDVLRYIYFAIDFAQYRNNTINKKEFKKNINYYNDVIDRLAHYAIDNRFKLEFEEI